MMLKLVMQLTQGTCFIQYTQTCARAKISCNIPLLVSRDFYVVVIWNSKDILSCLMMVKWYGKGVVNEFI